MQGQLLANFDFGGGLIQRNALAAQGPKAFGIVLVIHHAVLVHHHRMRAILNLGRVPFVLNKRFGIALEIPDADQTALRVVQTYVDIHFVSVFFGGERGVDHGRGLRDAAHINGIYFLQRLGIEHIETAAAGHGAGSGVNPAVIDGGRGGGLSGNVGG